MKSHSGIATLKDSDLEVSVYNGQLATVKYMGVDLIHQGSLPVESRGRACSERIKNGAPGYSGLEMLPFVSKPSEVWAGKKIENYDTQGPSRSIPFSTHEWTDEMICCYQEHDGETPILNSKFLETGKGPEYLYGICNYILNKSFMLEGGKVQTQFELFNNGNGQSPFWYDFGTHPVGIAPGNYSNLVFASEGIDSFDLTDVLKEKGNVMLLDGIEKMTILNKETGVGMNFEHNFGHTMIWTPGVKQGVFGFEPKSMSGIRDAKKTRDGKKLDAGENHYYTMSLEPFVAD